MNDSLLSSAHYSRYAGRACAARPELPALVHALAAAPVTRARIDARLDALCAALCGTPDKAPNAVPDKVPDDVPNEAPPGAPRIALTDDALKKALRQLRTEVFCAVMERDLRGDADLAEVTGAMTDLAEISIQRALAVITADLEARFGEPRAFGCGPSGGRLDGQTDGRQPDGRSGGRTDGQPDGQSDGRSDEQPDSQSDRRTDGQPDGRPDGQSDGKSNGRPDGRSDGQLDDRPDGRADEKPNGQPGERTDEQPDNQPDERTDGQPNGQLNEKPVIPSGERLVLGVVGMGKLGGRELNVSSDIDLVFVYEDDGETTGGARGPRAALSTQEFFARAGKRLIAMLNDVSADGYVFRVDMRLRPNGNAGPLVCSLAMLEEYFYVQGREWERYAWIKGRLVSETTSAGAQRLAARLDALVKPFVWRRYLDFGVIEAIRALHAQIRQEARRRASMRPEKADDIKLGRGGIREIEFSAQALQLIRGGQDAGFRVRPTLAVLRHAASAGLIAPAVCDALERAYLFLRRLEHRLQYRDDAQTHAIAPDPAERDALAQAMGYAGYAALAEALGAHRDAVEKQFDQIFADKSACENSDASSDGAAAWVWSSALAEESDSAGEGMEGAGGARENAQSGGRSGRQSGRQSSGQLSAHLNAQSNTQSGRYSNARADTHINNAQENKINANVNMGVNTPVNAPINASVNMPINAPEGAHTNTGTSANTSARIATSTGARTNTRTATGAGITENANTAALHERLAELGIETGADALLARLRGLWRSPRYAALPARSRQRFDALARRTLDAARTLKPPEKRADTLARMFDLLETVGRRGAYLALLTEYPDALARVLAVLGASRWAAGYLIRHPQLLDELLDDEAMAAPFDAPGFSRALRERVAAADGAEQQMDLLRHAHQAEVFRTLLIDLAGRLPVEGVSDRLSDLADAVLDVAIETVWQQFPKRHRDTPRFAAIAYGKLGGKELGYASDLDLIFLYDDTDDPTDSSISAPEIYTVFTRRLITWLSAATGAGTLFDIDLRLRPNGESGLLVTSLDAFRRYQLREGDGANTAWVWEHQALTRARFCAGDAHIGARFEAIRVQVLSTPREAAPLAAEIVTMRQRVADGHPNRSALFDLKHDRGGMVDIEFLVQYWVLLHAAQDPALIRNTGNIALLREVSRFGLMSAHEADTIGAAYRAYRRLQHQLRLDGMETARVDPARVSAQRDAVLGLWWRVLGA